MSIQIRRIDVDTAALKKYFAQMSVRAENFAPVFRWVMVQLAAEHAKLFATNGLASGTAWEPLHQDTVAWKIANGYGANGILVRTGDLKSSLTNLNSGRGAVREIDRKHAVFGTDVAYARYHFYGTRRMPERKPLFVPEFFAWRTGQAAAKHIVHGKIPAWLDTVMP